MALEFTPPHEVARRPRSTQDLLLRAIALPKPPLPKVDSRGSVSLTPRYPMRGQAAEPAPVPEISFPQAEAGQEIIQTVTRTTRINLAETLRLHSERTVKARAQTLAATVGEARPETRELEPMPDVPQLSGGPITQAIDRRRAGRFGR